MTTRIPPMEVDSIYHIYNRGVNREKIFFSKKNYDYFVYKMSFHFQKKAAILAYCLMPNHFHILVKVQSPDFIQGGLRPFFIAYTLAVNNEQNRVGPLFQGHYQSNLIDSDDYLLECLQYIHANPVKAGLVARPQEWEYSSYRAYFTKNTNSMIQTKWIFDFFDSIQEFSMFSQSAIEDREPVFFKDYS